MILCQCKGTTDSEIRHVVRKGASNLYEVGKLCSAGTECGGCQPAILQIVETENRNVEHPLLRLHELAPAI